MTARRRRRAVTSAGGTVAIAFVAFVGLVHASSGGAQDPPFPHEAHQGLFPLCVGCHTTASGEEEPGFPDPALCARCHDGAELDSVFWEPPADSPGTLAFTHGAHEGALAVSGEDPQGCEACHVPPAGPRMRVGTRVVQTACFACHTPGSDAHFDATEAQAGATCETCHVPLAATSLSAAGVRALPAPADHRTGAFLSATHGVQAGAEAGRCATCHTAERCLACHVDVDNPHVKAVPRAGEGLELPPAVAAYPVPATHTVPRWAERHDPVPDAGTCNTCHTTEDCRACHVASVPSVVEALPRRADVSAPGIGLRARTPPTHESPFFLEAHAGLAAANAGTCATCHSDGYCTDCHDAPAGNSYHPPDFSLAHGASAFGRADECASCHEVAVFCRACHIESGLGSAARPGSGVVYHDAEPIWLLRHGQAARQSLESCASCHRQNECVQCHGVLGSFRVSPHRPGFDAERAWAKSPRTCFACHVGNPLSGG